MTFVGPGERIPTAIENITVRLHLGAVQTAEYWLTLVDQLGVKIEFAGDSGDLVPHLTAGEIDQLQAFMASLKARAEEQLLPEGETS